MKNSLSRLLWIVGSWVLVISAWVIFNISYITSYIIIWIGYIIISILLSIKIWEIVGWLKKKTIMDAELSQYNRKSFISMICCIMIAITWWILLYNYSIIDTTAQDIAHWTSTHIVFEQWKAPCISLWAFCK